MTGPALGRPKSATFRTLDIVGLDIVGRVAANLQLPVPSVLQSLIERGWIGEKAGQGFYKRTDSEILVLDPETLTYRPKRPVQIPALEAIRTIENPAERLKTLFLDQGKAGRFLRATLGPTLLHTALVAPDIAHSIDDVDRAMRWGFGWELGPFEIWDAIGLREVLDAMPAAAGVPEVPTVGPEDSRCRRQSIPERRRSAGRAGPADSEGRERSQPHRSAQRRRQPRRSRRRCARRRIPFEDEHDRRRHRADAPCRREGSRPQNFAALVVGNDAPNFSAGANLMLVLLEAQEGNWDDIDLMVRAFQEATQALRYADVPVIVAPAGLTIGGGCEIALHGDRVQAAAESYIGLVEVGVGLIPAGGGTKEMLARSVSDLPRANADLLPFVQQAFETIGFAKVSTSALDARRLGFVTDADRVTMNRERLMSDAKALALERARDGYQPPVRRTIPVGGDGVLAALKLGIHLAWRAGRISDHDAAIARALALVMAGGALPHATVVSEQHLLDLEREAFLKLCGERKTLERIQYTLKTGKTLRN